MACLALGLAVSTLLPGCASSRERGAPGAELNPTVTGRPTFIGHDVPMVIFDVEVEQTDPMIERPHTWAVHAWVKRSHSDDVSAAHAAWIKEEPPHACRPALRAGREEVEVKYVLSDGAKGAKYLIVVVEVVEMTGGPHATVYATKTYARAFESHGSYPDDGVIPLCTDGVPIAEASGG